MLFRSRKHIRNLSLNGNNTKHFLKYVLWCFFKVLKSAEYHGRIEYVEKRADL